VNDVKHRLLYTIIERRGECFIPSDPSLIRNMHVPYYDGYKELELRDYCEL